MPNNQIYSTWGTNPLVKQTDYIHMHSWLPTNVIHQLTGAKAINQVQFELKIYNPGVI